MSPAVLVDRRADGITTLTLNSPETLNALDQRMVDALTEALAEVRVDRDCRVVILAAAGRAFCAGYNLKGYGDEDQAEQDGLTLSRFSRQSKIAELVLALHELPQPVIAAVQGAAVGGGLALVCASDIRIATTTSRFAVAFITAGCSGCDLGVSWLLPRIVGAGRAHELMLTGRRFDATEALGAGLLSRMVEPEDLLASARQSAEQICANPPASVELTKTGMWVALETPSLRTTIEFENRQQVMLAATDDAAEAATAFLEKRKPRFSRH